MSTYIRMFITSLAIIVVFQPTTIIGYAAISIGLAIGEAINDQLLPKLD